MQLPDAASAIALGVGPQDYFIYYGREGESVPNNVTHVKIHSSVKTIRDSAFRFHGQLRIVILNEELEEIGAYAFNSCTSLYEIVIPNAVKTIQEWAFNNCTGLTTVTLGEGLEDIGLEAFGGCRSLHEIVIPNAVRTIKGWAFYNCSGMTTVTLGEGLEEIGAEAFYSCTSLEEIVIPNAVKTIKWGAFSGCTMMTTVTLGDGVEEIGDFAIGWCTSLELIVIPHAAKTINDGAFKGSSNLTSVRFCDEIEEFVSCVAMRGWWNHGVHQRCLNTYCLLVKFNIPNRLALVLVQSWQANIYDMLGRIPTVSTEGLVKSLFGSIDTKLTLYENMSEAPMLLELAIPNDDIVQRILTFF
jgi:hypothetical protein